MRKLRLIQNLWSAPGDSSKDFKEGPNHGKLLSSEAPQGATEQHPLSSEARLPLDGRNTCPLIVQTLTILMCWQRLAPWISRVEKRFEVACLRSSELGRLSLQRLLLGTLSSANLSRAPHKCGLCLTAARSRPCRRPVNLGSRL